MRSSGCFATVMAAECKDVGTPVSVKMIDKHLIESVEDVTNEISVRSSTAGSLTVIGAPCG